MQIARFPLVLAVVSSLACVPGGSSVVPALGAILSRVDVPRLLECGRHVPDYGAAAKCLGARAATEGIRLALDKALALAEDAEQATSPTGADDYTDAQREALAGHLEVALEDLGVQIDAANVAE